jgi:hypothetical protein
MVQKQNQMKGVRNIFITLIANGYSDKFGESERKLPGQAKKKPNKKIQK